MFERMGISEGIYEGVVTPSYKKMTWAEAKNTGIISNKRGASAFSNNQTAKYGSSGKYCKLYVDCSKSTSKTCMIPGAVNSYDECKVLRKFGTKEKYQGRDTTPKNVTRKTIESYYYWQCGGWTPHGWIQKFKCCQSRGTICFVKWIW